jgi:hypothetical protein
MRILFRSSGWVARVQNDPRRFIVDAGRLVRFPSLFPQGPPGRPLDAASGFPIPSEPMRVGFAHIAPSGRLAIDVRNEVVT